MKEILLILLHDINLRLFIIRKDLFCKFYKIIKESTTLQNENTFNKHFINNEIEVRDKSDSDKQTDFFFTKALLKDHLKNLIKGGKSKLIRQGKKGTK